MMVKCNWCPTVMDISVTMEQIDAWRGGMHIQDAMPHLTASEREMFISGTCDNCWTNMFGTEDE